MRRITTTGMAILLVTLLIGAVGNPRSAAESSLPRLAPAFTHSAEQDWINSPPLDIADLRGRVVLIDFWTFDCWNCYRSFPWLDDVESRFAEQGLTVIGVHTPEFAHERVRNAVEQKVKEFSLRHPIMLDNDFSYWKAMENRYWPAFYLIGKGGNIRNVHVGETHVGDRSAKRIERDIEALLAEDHQ